MGKEGGKKLKMKYCFFFTNCVDTAKGVLHAVSF